MKLTRGVKSSEFLVAVLGTAAGVHMAHNGIQAGEIFAALSPASAYVGGRSIKKAMRGEDD